MGDAGTRAIGRRELVQPALDAVHGVDLNPFAVAIARFRLLVAALHAAGFRRLADAPVLPIHVAVGDSLLWRCHSGSVGCRRHRRPHVPLPHRRLSSSPSILQPAATTSWSATRRTSPSRTRPLNAAYRERYSTCHRQYALAVPFMERFFQLASRGDRRPARPDSSG